MLDKTAYFSILKQLHDTCRNNPAPTLTGMDAYNEIINYLYLRHLSDNNGSTENDESNLEYYYKNYCLDSHILEDEKREIYNKMNKSGKPKEKLNYTKLSEVFLPRLVNNEENENIGFVKIIGDNIKDLKVDMGRLTNLVYKCSQTSVIDGGKKVQRLINKIYTDKKTKYNKDEKTNSSFLPLTKKGKFNLKLFPYDALGEGFEKFMNDAGSRGGNWGQHFTNIQVGKWICEKIKLNKDDKIIDPFAGSGGLLLSMIKQYEREHKTDNKKIKFNKKNIYAHELDDKIYKFLVFNSKIARIYNESNILKGDSFDYVHFLKRFDGYFDKIITNPPFGISVNIYLNEALKEYWGILKSGKYTIKDSMGLAVYVIFKMLKDGGQAGFVTDRGILNNGTETRSWQKKLRKMIINESNITDILLLPKGIFSHTNFDTAVIIMKKGERTEKINFHQGYFKESDKGKEDKKMYIKENILTLTFKQLYEKDWSLKYDDYVEKKEITYNGIEYKTLGEVFELYPTTKHKTSLGKTSGKYRFYNSSQTDKLYLNTYEINKESLIIGNGGASNIHYDIQFTPSKHVTVCFIKKNYEKTINLKFIYYYFYINRIQMEEMFNGGGLKWLNRTNIKKLKIPILPESHQQEIVEFMDKFIDGDYKKLNELVSGLKNYDLFKLLINKNYTGFENIYEFYKQLKFMKHQLKLCETVHLQNIKKACFKGMNAEYKTLGEVCELQGGIKYKLSKQPITTKTDILYLRGGDVKDYSIDYFNGVYFDYNDDKFSKYEIKKGDLYYTLVGTVGICGEYKIDKRTIISGNLCKLYDFKINKKYINYYLVFNKPKYNSNAQPNISKNTLSKIKIPVPSLKEQQEIVDKIEEIDKPDSVYNKTLFGVKNCIKMIENSIELTLNDTYDNNINLSNEETFENFENDKNVKELEIKHNEQKILTK